MIEFILFLLIGIPFIHLVHELGHVVVARIFHVKKTRIVLGMGSPVFQFSILGTSVEINKIYMFGGYSTNDEDGKLSYLQQALISLGGPTLNILLIFASIPFITRENVYFFTLFISFNIWIALSNLIPFKFGDKRSDGWVIASSIYYGISAFLRKYK
ncbi:MULTISPECIES: site-2 protease family protein [Bacillus]|uniref:site-2 protease family protein n=1 Tax=Bacillus TaxID=1386 RepID=UPI000BB8AA80|nr:MULTISPECIES: site-2 protease family protein [Bacillus]